MTEETFWQYAFRSPDGEIMILDGTPKGIGLYKRLVRRRMRPTTEWTVVPQDPSLFEEKVVDDGA